MSAPKISAFVVSYNRAGVLAECLRALSFADELIVVDKTSTDGSRSIAETVATRVITVPWTPTVEETRTLALSQCSHDWILFADDDECFNLDAGRLIQAELSCPRADIYTFPLRHYILGVHDERAYYWPEFHVRLFRRGSVTFSRTVHAGIHFHSDRILQFAVDDGIVIHHLSHPDVAEWVEKTNRYTSRSDRSGVPGRTGGLAAFAKQRIDHWSACGKDDDPDGYAAAVGLLRAVYDIVDMLKTWETERKPDGSAPAAQGDRAGRSSFL